MNYTVAPEAFTGWKHYLTRSGEDKEKASMVLDAPIALKIILDKDMLKRDFAPSIARTMRRPTPAMGSRTYVQNA